MAKSPSYLNLEKQSTPRSKLFDRGVLLLRASWGPETMRVEMATKPRATVPILLTAGLAVGLVPDARVRAQVRYDSIALSGSVGSAMGLGPNLGPGVHFQAFESPSLNNAGEIAFSARLAGVGITEQNGNGIWQTRQGVVTLVAREGAEGPGPNLGPAVVFDRFDQPVLNESGELAFDSFLRGISQSGGLTQAFFRCRDEISVVALPNNDAYGPNIGPGIQFSGFVDIDPILNAAGQMPIYGVLRGTGVTADNNRGIWRSNRDSALQLTARTGSEGPGPGVEPGVYFSNLGEPCIDGAGELIFFAPLTGAGITTSNDGGIWRSSGSGGLQIIAREGVNGPGPNLGDGVYFASIFYVGANATGAVTFTGRMGGVGIDATNQNGVWRCSRDGQPTIVARSGSQSLGPNVGPGVVFSQFEKPVMNSAGNVAFRAFLTGANVDSTNNTGIWRTDGEVISVIARSGAVGPGPGVGAGVGFASFVAPTMNSMGDVAFMAVLTGANVTFANDTGIWCSVDGALIKVALEGDTFDVDPGAAVDLRTISLMSVLNFVAVSGGEDGRARSLSDNRMLAFQLSFTDGSAGVFTAVLPEPASGAVLSLCAAIILQRRRVTSTSAARNVRLHD